MLSEDPTSGQVAGPALNGANPCDRTYERCLQRLKGTIPFRYAQWLVEDSDTHDFRVVASALPDGESGYDVAHRTGIIGQVFRTEKPIVAPEVRGHALYDPFDNSIDWELCFPVYKGSAIIAVVNIEGPGMLKLDCKTWASICTVVYESTNCRPRKLKPRADEPCLLSTRRILVSAPWNDAYGCDALEAAMAIAHGGRSTLLVGPFPDLLRGRAPTMEEAMRQGLGISYCYVGLDRRLDLLSTGRVSREALLGDDVCWWSNSKGRYEFVVAWVEDNLEKRNSRSGYG